MANDHKALVQALNNCAAACNHCLASCLGEDDIKMLRDCIRLDMDCADVCRLTASFIARGSAHGRHLLKECMELCRLCAVECDKHTRMQHCRDCAAACRSCMEACKAAA